MLNPVRVVTVNIEKLYKDIGYILFVVLSPYDLFILWSRFGAS